MDERGFVFGPLDLKILILTILRRLPEEIETDRLLRLCQEDGVVNYFDFSVGLDELRETGQVEIEDDWCRITERGIRNADTLENSLPYSVRRLAEKTAEKEAAAIARGNSIVARHRVSDGVCTVELGLNDGISDILRLSVLCADEKQAKKIEKKFRRHAEETWQKIMEILSDEERAEHR